MELTAWQRFCNRILGRILKKRARRDVALSENLVKGSMGIMPEVYLSTVIFKSCIDSKFLTKICLPSVATIKSEI